MISNYKTNLIELHISVFLFGFAALFGKLINQSPIVIVCGRSLFAIAVLFIVLRFLKQNLKLSSRKDYLALILLGIILAVHWFSFFKSVQVSNVAICVLTFSTYPMFVTFLEPYFFKEKIRLFDIMTAFITLFGISLIVPKFELENNLTQGALWGILAGFTCALLSIFNKKYVRKYSSLLLAFYENLVCAVVLFPFLIFMRPVLYAKDIFLLLILGVIFTALAHSLFIKGMTHVKAQLASIITCLEPIYGIVFAIFLLHEIPQGRTILGGAVIIGATILATVKSK